MSVKKNFIAAFTALATLSTFANAATPDLTVTRSSSDTPDSTSASYRVEKSGTYVGNMFVQCAKPYFFRAAVTAGQPLTYYSFAFGAEARLMSEFEDMNNLSIPLSLPPAINPLLRSSKDLDVLPSNLCTPDGKPQPTATRNMAWRIFNNYFRHQR